MSMEFSFKSKKNTEMIDITSEVQSRVSGTGVKEGLVVVYVPHTTAAVTINEGADPSVRADIVETFNEIVPWDKVYGHAEGNSPAHIKASLVGASETLILEGGRLLLGQWQHIFFCEFDGPRERHVRIKVVSG
ncbi:MAG: secondary thiamine-phosphate synthase enzyme YjbQ [Proteobacteria bacterium]|nr:secondary thiamine-phosphate synthase enzyme YjbQ [Pseudomonadota bacterium]